MTDTVLVLVEDTLAAADVQHITSLHESDDVAYRVLVPADSDRPLLATIIDDLSLGELKDAWNRALGKEPDVREAKATAAEQLEGSLAALAAAGHDATGAVVADDPLPAVREAVAAGGVREVVVVTYPHAVADTFHRDWASRAREDLQVPVLHLYAGTSEIG